MAEDGEGGPVTETAKKISLSIGARPPSSPLGRVQLVGRDLHLHLVRPAAVRRSRRPWTALGSVGSPVREASETSCGAPHAPLQAEMLVALRNSP